MGLGALASRGSDAYSAREPANEAARAAINERVAELDRVTWNLPRPDPERLTRERALARARRAATAELSGTQGFPERRTRKPSVSARGLVCPNHAWWVCPTWRATTKGAEK